MRVGLGALAWAAAAPAVAVAAVCEISGLPAPDVATMTVPASQPFSSLVIVYPDCTASPSLPRSRGETYALSAANGYGAERVASVPSVAVAMWLSMPLSRGGDFTTGAPNLKTLEFEGISASAAAKTFSFPSSLQTLRFSNTDMSDFSQLVVPNGVSTLTINKNKRLTSLAKLTLPASVTTLDLGDNQLSTIDFPPPPSVSTLTLSGNPITKLDGAVLSDSLGALICQYCAISSIRGVKLPSSLTTLNIDGTFTNFEIRKSDVPIVNGLIGSFRIDQPKCADKTAKPITLPHGNVCVISDARFKELYEGGPPAPPDDDAGSAPSPNSPSSATTPSAGSTSKKPSTSGGSTNSTDVSAGSAGGTISSSRKDGTSAGGTTGGATGGGEGTGAGGGGVDGGGSSGIEDGATSTGEGGDSGTTSKTNSKTAKPPGGNSATSTKESSSSSSNSTVIVIAIAGTAVALIMGAFGYRILFGAKKSPKEETTLSSDKYTTAETPQTSSSGSHEPPQSMAQEYLENDVRNDKALSLYRIDRSAIQLGDKIAQGGYGVIYHGVFDGQRVAVKQMAPNTWQDEAKVKSFMDEIRLCVSLDHPKVVRCIGISWTSLRDLSAVIEYMSGGDLHSVLQKHSGEPTGREWSEPWTNARLKNKTLMAMDIAEAVVYLHSFRSPIIHRDLKAKNVLLDSEGNAKLSDFGISREVSMDETMTREIGTVAWIAPEVLRGERYTEVADIYSLGVLLIELDRCRHPYSHEDILAADETDSRGRNRPRAGPQSQAVMKNTRIAILVSTGKLRPHVSASCPPTVKALVDKCLSPDAATRPNAMEVYHGLRQIRKGFI